MADAVSFTRTDEQQLIATTLRELLEARVDLDDTRRRSLTNEAIDRMTWEALCDMGLAGLTIPEVHGGLGAPFADAAVVCEELGRVVASVPLVSTIVASEVILGLATDEQKLRWLPSIASGSAIPALAVFEDPHARVDSFSCTATGTAGGWAVTGTKRYVLDASHADLFVVLASVDDDSRAFVVEAGGHGVTVEAVSALDATRPMATVAFDTAAGSAIPLGDEAGDGASVHDVLRGALDRGVVALAAEQVGGAQHCLEAAVEYAKTRHQFGRAIGSFQAVKHRCADMLVATEHARSAAWYAATVIDDPEEAEVAVPLAKSVCSDAYVKVAGDAIQIFGGVGFTWEHDLHLYLKRAKSSAALFGSIGASRDRLAAAIGA